MIPIRSRQPAPSSQFFSSGQSQRPAPKRLTPVSDSIRARFEAATKIEATLAADHPLDTPSVAPAALTPIIQKGNDTLPPFQERELDDQHLLSCAATEIYRMRRARDRVMPEGLTGEPAWDILLALYTEHPTKLPVSSVAYGSGTAPTTALRWFAHFEQRGWLERSSNPSDQRLSLVNLTDEGRVMMERCLKAMLRSAGR